MSDYQIFNSGVLGTLKTLGFVPTSENDLACDACLMSVSEWAATKNIDLSGAWVEDHYNGAQVAALQDFGEWVKNWRGMPKTFTLSTVTVNVQFPIGATGAVLTLGASAIVDSEKMMGRAYIEVYDSILAAYEIFRNKRKVDAPAKPSGNGSNGDSPTAEKLVVMDVIVEERNGKRYYKLAGGRWLKFGVPCWPEVFDAAGIDPTEFEPGRQQFPTGYQMQVELDNDKPKKVTRLISKG